MNDGKRSQEIFVERMNAQPRTHVFRNRDKKDLMGLNRGRRVAAFALPADYTVARTGELFFAEVKSQTKGDRFDYSRIEPGQRSAASICAACGAGFYFFIHRLEDDTWFELPAELFAMDIKAGKKSRKFKEMPACSMM